MSTSVSIDSRGSILCAPTPAAWVEDALAHLPELLQDHANCEKKAASTALALMFAYPEDRALGAALARLAREELRHFEQVLRALTALGLPFARQRPGRYAQQLRRAACSSDPGRKLDLLLIGALIEARSAERFTLLAPHLSAPLARLYADLAGAEARHFVLYLGFARTAAPQEWRARLEALAAREAQLATEPDDTLRFHSGPLCARGD
ncbi:MAG TPA: tRNA isopentenyl-2-thiomethyl-A-37 hydroxylase MiaE [Steroidobacteraceae bacterium]|jgi:tRNA-(ms[2]io[6]A)-hydroxylase|nr:tRNA isopentenyl-2-thiomethyl-A-37 hydroxylase MiaE [Steroidobacteraceae bacterium]